MKASKTESARRLRLPQLRAGYCHGRRGDDLASPAANKISFLEI